MSNDRRRRLEPLRITPKERGHEASGARPEHESGSEPRRAGARASRAVVAAVVLGLAVIAGAIALIFGAAPRAAPALAAPSISLPVPQTTRETALPSWTDTLHATECPSPCSGGTACAVTTENGAKERCRVGAGRCDACVSGVSCIAGDQAALFTGWESWSLHLSAIAERGPGRSVVDPCKTKRDLWLCLRSKSKPSASCVSQVEACRNGARSIAAIAITSNDLISSGVDLEIREGGPSGAVLAVKTGAKYPDGVNRTALCGGLRMNFADTTTVAYVTYFLDAASGPTPAAPGSNPTACRAEDWISRVPSTEHGRRARTALGDDHMKEGKVRNLGDLNGDGLQEFEISYAWGATGWGMTLMSSTGGADCFKTVYEGGGSVASVSDKRTQGWRDITVGYSTIIGDRGRGVVTAIARHGAAGYVLGEVVDCATLGGDAVDLDDCRRLLSQ